jgi:hypothetical protein
VRSWILAMNPRPKWQGEFLLFVGQQGYRYTV